MNSQSRFRLGLATLVLIPAIAVGVFGVRAVSTPVGSAPAVPAGILPDVAPPAGRAVPVAAAQAPVVDLAVWEETDGVTRPGR